MITNIHAVLITKKAEFMNLETCALVLTQNAIYARTVKPIEIFGRFVLWPTSYFEYKI